MFLKWTAIISYGYEVDFNVILLRLVNLNELFTSPDKFLTTKLITYSVFCMDF